MTRHDIPMDEIESRMRSLKRIEQQNVSELEEKNGVDDNGDPAAHEEVRRR